MGEGLHHLPFGSVIHLPQSFLIQNGIQAIALEYDGDVSVFNTSVYHTPALTRLTLDHAQKIATFQFKDSSGNLTRKPFDLSRTSFLRALPSNYDLIERDRPLVEAPNLTHVHYITEQPKLIDRYQVAYGARLDPEVVAYISPEGKVIEPQNQIGLWSTPTVLILAHRVGKVVHYQTISMTKQAALVRFNPDQVEQDSPHPH